MMMPKNTLLLCTMLALMFVGAQSFAKSAEPGDRLHITSAGKKEGIIGSYSGSKGGISFSIIENQTNGDITAVFTNPNTQQTAQITVSEEGESRFAVAGIKWNGGKKLQMKQKKILRKFGKTELARAIIETAAYSAFKTSDESLRYRVTAIQLYEEISRFYSAKNKKLSQPASQTIPDGCFLETSKCDLISSDAIWGCKAEKPHIDVMVLIDGLPSECRLHE